MNEDETCESGPFETLLSRLGRRLDSDKHLRDDLRRVLVLLHTPAPGVDRTEATPTTAAMEESLVPEAAEALIEEVPPPGPANHEPPAGTSVPVTELQSLVATFGRQPPPATPAVTYEVLESSVILKRVAIKRAAVLLALERAAQSRSGEPLTPRAHAFAALIKQAREQPNCYLWMCHGMHEKREPEEWRRVLNCFQALERALRLTEQVLHDTTQEARLLPSLLLLAEAKSALISEGQSVFHIDDADAIDTHEFLCATGYERRVFINRFMTAADPADPELVPALLDRIAELEYIVTQDAQERDQRRQLLNRVKYELKQAGGDMAESALHWQKVVEAVTALVKSGLPASHAGLRDLLLPTLENLPDEQTVPLSDAFRDVLRAIDIHEALREQTADAPAFPATVTPEVERAREALKDGTMVIIGGDCRQESRRAIMRAFQLKEVNWIETRPHETSTQFEPAVARPEVRAVLLAIRWSSHSYGDVKSYCDRHDKPLVRLPRGYGINQIAHEICQQIL
jgi:hypothetical protein